MVISCNAQADFTYRKIPFTYDHLYKDTFLKRAEILKTLNDPFYISSLLPEKYDKTGEVDYTQIFQKAIFEHREVVFPAGIFKINQQGLTLPSNTKVYFDENSILKLEKNSLIRYEILRIHDAENVEVYYANIIGDRYLHSGNAGEWGFGISVQDSKNIMLYKPIVKNCWGDGIFIGSEGKILSKDIIINGGLVDNNRRNGISITSVINLSLSNIIASNSNGTFPKAGIDIEPSNNWEFIKNVNLLNIVTYNNEEDGLSIVLAALKAPDAKIVSINIRGHKDLFSKFGMGLLMDNKKLIGKLPVGEINIENVSYEKNKIGNIRNYSQTPSNAIKINIKNIKSDNKIPNLLDQEVVPDNLKIMN
jgi:hypothetical protein